MAEPNPDREREEQGRALLEAIEQMRERERAQREQLREQLAAALAQKYEKEEST